MSGSDFAETICEIAAAFAEISWHAARNVPKI
jgi:hypothetical protein